MNLRASYPIVRAVSKMSSISPCHRRSKASVTAAYVLPPYGRTKPSRTPTEGTWSSSPIRVSYCSCVSSAYGAPVWRRPRTFGGSTSATRGPSGTRGIHTSTRAGYTHGNLVPQRSCFCHVGGPRSSPAPNSRAWPTAWKMTLSPVPIFGGVRWSGPEMICQASRSTFPASIQSSSICLGGSVVPKGFTQCAATMSILGCWPQGSSSEADPAWAPDDTISITHKIKRAWP
jgi:hypothetical protein